MDANKIFTEALKELDELIEKHLEKMIKAEAKHGKQSEEYKHHESLIHGFNLRVRQTKHLMTKFK